MPDAGTILAFAVVLAVGSMIQTTAGFGFALFTVPVLVMLGCRSYEAIVLVAVSASAQAVFGVYLLRRHLHWLRVLGMIGLATLAMPIGVAVLAALAEHDRTTVRRVLGFIVLFALVLQVALRPEPRDRLPGAAMVGAMLGAGFMGGLSGMSGPPAVIWVMAHRWSNPESRATLWAFFGGTTPIQLVLLWREFGEPIVRSAELALLLVPAPLLGLLPGLWIGHRIPKPWLRTLSTAILTLVAAYAILRP
ncbi:MAG: TSUP family transporter [Planctomycetota bacterium]|jgi:uncharacterized membrane protein YfcA